MKYVLLLLVIFSLLISCKSESTLKIAVSSNLQFVIKDIVAEFEKENNIKVLLIINASGKLASQIEFGAPFDIFISANTQYPNYLNDKRLLVNSPKVYAYGKIVLWSANKINITPSYLLNNEVKKIAIPNPKVAPYGKICIDYLKYKQLYAKVKSKLVYAQSVSQCNQFITSNSVDVGFTAYSVVLHEKIKKQNWVLLKEGYNPLPQSISIVKSTKLKLEAVKFFNYMFSKKVQKKLLENGYNTNAKN